MDLVLKSFEEISIPRYQYSYKVGEQSKSVYFDIKFKHECNSKVINLCSKTTLQANQAYSYKGEIQLPADSQPNFTGKISAHCWLYKVALGTFNETEDPALTKLTFGVESSSETILGQVATTPGLVIAYDSSASECFYKAGFSQGMLKAFARAGYRIGSINNNIKVLPMKSGETIDILKKMVPAIQAERIDAQEFYKLTGCHSTDIFY